MRYNARARTDLELIWIESATRFGEAQADALIDRIVDTLNGTLCAFPAAGRLRPELGAGIRSYPVPPFIAFYRTARSSVEIIRILHTHRDIKEPLLSLLIA
jgi:toxin ParE1/3/4